MDLVVIGVFAGILFVGLALCLHYRILTSKDTGNNKSHVTLFFIRIKLLFLGQNSTFLLVLSDRSHMKLCIRVETTQKVSVD